MCVCVGGGGGGGSAFIILYGWRINCNTYNVYCVHNENPSAFDMRFSLSGSSKMTSYNMSLNTIVWVPSLLNTSHQTENFEHNQCSLSSQIDTSWRSVDMIFRLQKVFPIEVDDQARVMLKTHEVIQEAYDHDLSRVASS